MGQELKETGIFKPRRFFSVDRGEHKDAKMPNSRGVCSHAPLEPIPNSSSDLYHFPLESRLHQLHGCIAPYPPLPCFGARGRRLSALRWPRVATIQWCPSARSDG